MKKYFLFAAAAVAMAAACSKEAPVAPASNDYAAPAEDGAPVAVQFGSNIKAVVETKAQGSVDSWNAGQTLYIYGFQRAATMDYSAAPFINNVAAISPAKDADPTLTGSIEVINPSATVEGQADYKEPFYYSGNNTYDFYGYYIDDAGVVAEGATAHTVSPQVNGVYVPVVINGGQDIMVATATPADDFAKSTYGFTEEEKTAWANVDYKYAYSAYAARRDVHPTLKFNHLLTRINFYIESGSELTEDNQLYVTGLKVQNVNTSADLCVAGEALGFSNYGAAADLSLMEPAKDAEGNTLANLVALTDFEVPNKGEAAKQLGACMMLFPSTSFDILLSMKQNGVVAGVDDLPKTLEIAKVMVPEYDEAGAPTGNYVPTTQTEFAAGYQYNVTLKIYGLSEVEIFVELVEWADGGKIDIDTDELPTIY